MSCYTCMKCFVELSFGNEINRLANIDCVKSLENVDKKHAVSVSSHASVRSAVYKSRAEFRDSCGTRWTSAL